MTFVAQILIAVDKDGDGQISRDEMAAYIKSYQEESPEEVHAFFYFQQKAQFIFLKRFCDLGSQSPMQE